MNKFLSILILLMPLLTQGQSAYQDVREGNEAFLSNQYEAAALKYKKGLAKDPEVIENAFNLGDALYRQGKYEEASKFFEATAKKAEDKEVKAKAFHNLGNSYLKQQKFQESVDAYKRALINNPKDEESRYNYSYAKKMLQEQQQQEKQQQDQNQEQEQEQQEQEQNQDQQEQNQDQQEQEQEQEQEQQEQEQKQEEQEQQQQQQQKEQQVSREDAERILEALNQEEKELQEKLKKQRVKQVEIDIEKDW